MVRNLKCMYDFIASEILFDVTRFSELSKSEIFNNISQRNPFLFSVIIEMLIRLRDLMFKSDKVVGTRVNFKDDVIITDTVKDITDLIKYAQDAVCHIESNNNIMDEHVYSSLSIIRGRGMFLKDLPSSVYDDDFAIIFGKQRIYYKHRMLRAFNQAVKNLLPFSGVYKDVIENITPI